MSLESFIQNNQTLLAQKELIFFGGSFNPWHEGHSSCINLMDQDKSIIVIPDHNPFKELVKNQNKSSSLDQIKQKLESFAHQTFLFSDFFEKNEKNPTHQWIGKLKSKFPEKKLSLLIGFDTFMSLDKWIESEKLLKDLHTLYIASRMDDESLKQRQIDLISKMSNVKLIFLGHHEYESVSSSKIRKDLSLE